MSQHCAICGELPSEDHCGRCHHNHDRLNKPLFGTSQLRAAKAATGDLTWAQFAKRCGVSPSTVDHWLYNGVAPRAKAARVIEEILG